jgi:N-acetylglucosamine-6-phosphate deacetylase
MTNVKTITGRDPRSGRNVTLFLEDGVIAHVDETPGNSDLFLSPSLVDSQVNGCSGCDVNVPQLTPNRVLQLVDAMLSRGVTCFAPTIITAPKDSICQALRVIAQTRPGGELVFTRGEESRNVGSRYA